LALVVHPQKTHRLQEAGAIEEGPWGASLVNPPVPKPVAFAGPLRGGVDTSPVWSNSGLTTITAFTSAIPYIQGVGSATLLVGPAALLVPGLFGDVNGDCNVDVMDVMPVAGRWRTPSGDIDGDGDGDIVDIALVAAHFGDSCG
jgi:hypothetical protein